MELRPYQIEAKKAVFAKLAEHKSTLLELATGLGKTIIFSHIANEWPGRVLVIAHRDELIRQAAEKIEHATESHVAIEMGADRADDSLYGTKVVVGSIQTLSRSKRRSRFHPDHFSLVVVDEGHHATARTYREVLDYFKSAKQLFVTATPKRADDAALGMVCESVAYQFGIEAAIDEGWLVPINQSVVKVDNLDFSKVRTIAEDFNQADLERILTEEEPLHRMVSSAIDLVEDRQTLWFCTSVAHAKAMANVLARYVSEDQVKFLSGETPRDERRNVVEAYKKGHIRHLLNCFDDETEILTSDGWVRGEDLTYQHKIANWNNGQVFFSEPLALVRRDREPAERMVVLETPRRSIRVTEGHSLAYRTYPTGKFLLDSAANLVGRMVQLPVSGMAEPENMSVVQKNKPISAARVRANSYCLRQSGWPADTAKEEAIRRIEQRESLRYAEPHELTEDECEFIGFWIGDGCRGRLASGGIEYTVAQSPSCPKIVDRIDKLIASIGVNSIKRRRREGKYGDSWIWSFPRGTGFGQQKRNKGLYYLEPYLQKNGTNLFWALKENQFDALVRGWWMADGNHGDSCESPPCLTFCGISKPLFNLIQAIACCRGYRVSMTVQKKTAKPSHTPLLRMRMRKTPSHTMTKHCLRFEEGWKEEKVWCVTSNTGKVIIRRRGTVTVTGQCALFLEGFDAPSTSAIVMARPTKSKGLYMQVLGRGTRPLPGTVDGLESAEERRAAILESTKPYMLVIDYAGNAGRHKIVQAVDVLDGKYSAAVIDCAKNTVSLENITVNLGAALQRAHAEVELMAEEKERLMKIAEEEERRKKITAKADYRVEEVSPFVKQYVTQEADGMCTDKQARYIMYLQRQAGDDYWTYDKARTLTKKQASGVIGDLKECAAV